MSEPLFRDIKREGEEIQKAHTKAAETISEFKELVERKEPALYMAKLRFIDPDLSEELGQDQFLYLWLSDVIYHKEEKIFSGVFFEVPKELLKWHQVGQRLGFEADDVFDWMINENGHVKGAFTIRLTRSFLETEKEKQEYDEYIGIKSYEP